jgi:hypothetical protein
MGVTRSALFPALWAILIAAGCVHIATNPGGGSSPAPHTDTGSTAYYEQNGSEFRLAVGTNLTVILNSTYWEGPSSSDSSVLPAQGTPTVSACPNPPFPGSGCGTVTAVFRAAAAGTATVASSRTSCGEAFACNSSQRTFTITVIVYAKPQN